MSFQNGILLAGAALIAVPIILHLIMRRQPRPLVFPALRLVRQQEQSNRRQMRFRHWLLLAARCGVVALLALALARPSIPPEAVGSLAVGAGVIGLMVVGLIGFVAVRLFKKRRTLAIALAAGTAVLLLSGVVAASRWWSAAESGSVLAGQESPVAAVLVFDTTPRMSYRHENQTRLEAAQELGVWLVDQFPAESEVAVVNARSDSSAFAVDRAGARKRIELLKPTPRSLPLPQIVGEAVERLKESTLERREVYVFTDLAAASWPDDGAERLRERLTEHADVAVYLVDVGVEKPYNFLLGDLVRLPDTVAEGGRLHVNLSLEHIGSGGTRTVELRLYNGENAAGEILPDRRPTELRSQKQVTLAPGGAEALTFELGGLRGATTGGPPQPKLIQGVVSIVEDDGLAIDNRRYFSVLVDPPRPVLLAAPAPADDYALFPRQALAPTPQDARFVCTVVDLARLREDPADTLRKYAAIALVDPTELDEATWSKLADYTTLGGGLAIFLGRNARVEAFNSDAAQRILPSKLLRPQAAGDRPYQLTLDGRSHPIVSRFPDSTIPWYSFPVWRYWRLEPLRAGATTPVRFNTGAPAVIEQPLGQGRVVTITTPVSDPASDRAWNWLPTGDNPWPFVMLMDGIFLHLVRSSDVQLNYSSGQTAVLPVDATLTSVTLTTPLGDQSRQPVDQRQGKLLVSTTDAPGSYRVLAGGTDKRFERGFSVNLPAAESRFERLNKESLDERLGAERYRLARTREEIVREVNVGRVGVKLYPWIVLTLAVLLIAEQGLGHWFYRKAAT